MFISLRWPKKITSCLVVISLSCLFIFEIFFGLCLLFPLFKFLLHVQLLRKQMSAQMKISRQEGENASGQTFKIMHVIFLIFCLSLFSQVWYRTQGDLFRWPIAEELRDPMGLIRQTRFASLSWSCSGSLRLASPVLCFALSKDSSMSFRRVQ